MCGPEFGPTDGCVPMRPSKDLISPCGDEGIAELKNSAMLPQEGDIPPTFSGRIHDVPINDVLSMT